MSKNRILAVMFAGALLLGLNGCSGDTGQPVEPAEQTPQTQQQVRGDTAEVNGVTYSVLSVERDAKLEYCEADSGNEFVVIKLLIVNNSGEKISYNGYDWKMENSNGQIEDQYIGGVENDLSGGDLKNGGKVEGYLCFEEPAGDDGLVLCHFASMFDDEPDLQIKID